MKAVLALACLLAVSWAKPSSNPDDVEWENYKRTYGKNYGDANSDLENVRRTLYFAAKEKVQAHNELYKKGLKSYTLALNKFADQHPKEVAQMLNGYKQSNGARNNEIYEPVLNGSLPKSVDWRKKNAVTPVKNQGQCGSCWAFSTTGAVEGQWALKKGKLVSLSEQQLVDCSSDEGNQGCEGGLMDNGFTYIKDVKGLETEKEYPYTGEDDTCAFKKGDTVATVSGFKDIKSGSESDLQKAVASVGPISIAIDASQDSFQLYDSGVYDESSCSSTQLDHGVLVVGYGEEDGNAYWLVKNSWGTDWGTEGYIKMARNKDNQCGIATTASFPVV